MHMLMCVHMCVYMLCVHQVAGRLMLTNPVMEGLGNAKTVLLLIMISMFAIMTVVTARSS